MVSELLLCLDVHKSARWARWDPHKGTEGADGTAHQATFDHFPAVLANQGGTNQLDACKCGAHLQERPERGSGVLQSYQSDLDAEEAYGADRLQGHNAP